MIVILGPGRCQGCGARVWWAELPFLPVSRCWRNDDTTVHACA